MSEHVSATTGCNLGCTYCYENPDRERKQEWVDRQYDIDKIMEQLEEWKEKYPKTPPGLHGGEPLLVKKEHMEVVFEFANEHYDGGTHIQTNGTLMDEEHVEMFRKYNVAVGISCDGPEELNRLRKASGERDSDDHNSTDNMTKRTHEAIEMCVDAGVQTNLITVLSTQNAGTEEKYEVLLDWLDGMNQKGVYGHFNPAIPYEDIQNDVSLDPEVLKDRFLRLWEWQKEEPYRRWGPASTYIDNLLGAKLTDCVNNKCDVFNAGAARIAKGNGETTGCGKTWSAVGDGVPFLQGPSTDNEYDNTTERYEVLKQTPGAVTEDEPDMGGCKGCKYWNVCQGGCPSSGINDDYRNRTIWCEAKYALYEKMEEDLRALLPNIRLITDLPWNADISERMNKWQLDIKPFAAMRPDTEGRSSTRRGFSHEFGDVEDTVPEDLMPDRSWEEQKEYIKDKHDEDIIIINEEERKWHVDSGMVRDQEVVDPDPDGWDEVEE